MQGSGILTVAPMFRLARILNRDDAAKYKSSPEGTGTPFGSSNSVRAALKSRGLTSRPWNYTIADMVVHDGERQGLKRGKQADVTQKRGMKSLYCIPTTSGKERYGGSKRMYAGKES